jgi:acetyl esterase/lipase
VLKKVRQKMKQLRKQYGFAPLAVLMILAIGLVMGLSLKGLNDNKRGRASNTATITAGTVTYCTPLGVQLKMDLHRPTVADNQKAVLWVHGGGWATGTRQVTERAAGFITELRSRGYLVASIDYRLAPNYKFPAQIQDTLCAVKYLRKNAVGLGIDPAKIGIMGGSAGGHLAALVGTGGGQAVLQPVQYSAVSGRVGAAVDLFGPADLTQLSNLNQAQRRILAAAFSPLTVAELRKYAPVTYIDNSDPEFLIIHGDQDATVPLSQSQNFDANLRAAGVESTLIVVQGGNHGLTAPGMNPTAQQIAEQIGDFFDAKL